MPAPLVTPGCARLLHPAVGQSLLCSSHSRFLLRTFFSSPQRHTVTPFTVAAYLLTTTSQHDTMTPSCRYASLRVVTPRYTGTHLPLSCRWRRRRSGIVARADEITTFARLPKMGEIVTSGWQAFMAPFRPSLAPEIHRRYVGSKLR